MRQRLPLEGKVPSASEADEVVCEAELHIFNAAARLHLISAPLTASPPGEAFRRKSENLSYRWVLEKTGIFLEDEKHKKGWLFLLDAHLALSTKSGGHNSCKMHKLQNGVVYDIIRIAQKKWDQPLTFPKRHSMIFKCKVFYFFQNIPLRRTLHMYHCGAGDRCRGSIRRASCGKRMYGRG